MRIVSFYCLFPLLHVGDILGGGEFPTLHMVIGMITDTVSGFQYLSEHLGVLVDVLADHEEGGLHVVFRQNG